MTVTDLERHRAEHPDDLPLHLRPTGTSRWQPTRAGILNIWRYYDEVFEFHRGRLLLRGPNGTGKSKALEVLLPFLFDASLRPNRLSTFGTSDRTMHWNLMGEGAGGVTRVGYVWLEFGSSGSEDRSFSCGARLQASTHTSAVGVDYFTTDRRIGVPGGLRLVNDQGQPLTRAALGEALGPHGVVHPSAQEYRAAVRTVLFPGMGEQRFDALITALLQLRTPKLSQRLDPGLLSTLLSRALPVLDQSDIAELAEGFERLDRQREELRRLDEVVDAAGRVAAHAKAYARRVLRAGAADLISATTTMDGLTRAARASEAEYQRVCAELTEADARAERLRERRLTLEARIEGLTSGDAYRQGQHLDQLRQQSTVAGRTAERLRERAARLLGEAAVARQRADEEELRSAEVSSRAEQTRGDLVRTAERLSLSSIAPAAGLATDAQAGRLVVLAAAADRERQIAEVRRALLRHRDAVVDRSRAEDDAGRATDTLTEARAAVERADAAHGAVLEAFAEQVVDWTRACTELRPDADALLAVIHSATALTDLVNAAQAEVAGRLADDRSVLRTRAEAVEKDRAEVAAELARSRGTVDLPPAAPLTRTARRTGRTGAPFWRVTAFAPGVPATVQAGVEAALEAAGLLDAWVSPDGGVLDADGHDVFLLAGSPTEDPAAPVLARTLAAVLVPEEDTPVPRWVVDRLLARIALDATLPRVGEVAVGADGSWRVAALTGTYAKPEAAHIGATARARARARRIAELEGELVRLDAVLGELTAALDALDRRRHRLDDEVRRRPSHEPVAAAVRDQLRAQARAEAAEEQLGAARRRVADAERAAAAALRTLSATGAERGLPTEADALDRLDQVVAELRQSVEAWCHAHLSARQTAALAVARRDGARSAVAVAEEATAESIAAEDAAATLRARLEAVEAAVGGTYQEVLTELGKARQDLGTTRDERTEVDRDSRRLLTRRGELDATRARDAAERDAAVSGRDHAGERFRALAAGLLTEDAGITLELADEDGVKATLEGARAVAAAWPTVPHEPRNVADAHHRLLETLHGSRDVLASRADVELVADGDVHLLSASVGGLRVGATGLLRAMTAERDSSRDDITSSEHELFDTTLTGDTRRHLAARIRQAGALVDAMNSRLDLVRTASDVAVRLTWQVDPTLPSGTRAARELLLKDPVHLSDADRTALHAFFRERIEDARAANTAVSWEQQLTEVFDYTSWHQFVVKVDRARGAGWEVLTKKLHGALSGGEKAIALHLPLFAAIAAHYQAVPGAPRLILLDEVFVGVDTANRGQVFALLSALDLDLLLTSDHEWCTYAELDGIAVHQLVTDVGDGDDAVTSVRFTWDGRRLTSDDRPAVAPAPAPAPVP